MLFILAATGVGLPVAAQIAPDLEQQRRLAEQKLKLVEMLLNSPAAQAASAGQDADAAAQIERGRTLLKQAKASLTGQQFPEAARLLDEVLRSVSKAGNRSAGSLPESVQKERFKDMSEQVATYRGSLADMSKDSRVAAAVPALLQRVDALADEGRKLAVAGRMGDANRKMADAYKLAVEEISRLRAGHEVVMSLKFASPVEEYAYEQKRFHSNEILVSMMVAEGKAEGDKRRMVDGFLQEAGKLKDQAAQLAQANSHKDAVAAMENAVIHLNRALQSMGVPVF